MIPPPQIERQPTKETQPADIADRIALLRLRTSDDPTARAVALVGCQVLRLLDKLTKGAA